MAIHSTQEEKLIIPYGTLRLGICHRVGSCILSWAAVENGLCLIFQAALNPPLHFNAMHLWDAVVDLRAKLRLIDVVLPEALKDQELLPIWDRLKKQVRKRYNKRHEVAHGCIQSVNGEEFFIPFGSLTSMIDPTAKRLTEDDLIRRDMSFCHLARAILWFREAFVARRRNPAAELPPVGDLEHLLTIPRND